MIPGFHGLIDFTGYPVGAPFFKARAKPLGAKRRYRLLMMELMNESITNRYRKQGVQRVAELVESVRLAHVDEKAAKERLKKIAISAILLSEI